MPAPRLSQSAEAARAAALQAEFNEKKWVWVPDEKEGYLAGWVHKEDGNVGDIVMAAGGEIRTVYLDTLSKMNPPKFDRVEDIADLTYLNEASVVHNLRLRYGSGAIYTYSGLFLVAINPYQSLPLYSDAIVHQYRSKRRDENPPHIFAVAERAWVNMGEERENQSILITGESGAGKTESTKKVIQYLAAIATDVHSPSLPHSRSPSISASMSFGSSIPSTGLPRSVSFRKKGHTLSPSMSGSHMAAKGRLGLLERQILQANPILEAFGNAQTQRNNNSSRFGKFVRIMFAPDGSIAGANIDWYLLEKSRVVVRSEAERSFHVFYQLMAGGGSLKDTLLLEGGVGDYEYLNKSRREVDGVDDKEEWLALKNALDIVGFSSGEQLNLFRIVAAVLHIGNIDIASTRSDDAIMPDPSQAERVCHLLGIPLQEFIRAVLRPRVLAGREWVTQARTRQQALDELSALCKTLYEKSFGLLVDRINQALDRPSSKSTFIGVLDIAGFEIFEVNAYEQLLINYTNEKLQQFFNYHMFVLEQEEYSREGIEWDYVNFGLDLQPTIDLIEANGSTIGILSCLDEECIMPKATDSTFTQKLHHNWNGEVPMGEETHPGREKYEPTRFEQGFVVHHYAGKVEYRTDGWLEKNKDPLNDNFTRILAVSSEPYVASLFAEFASPETYPLAQAGHGRLIGGKKRTTKKGAFRTVAQRHREQLSSLMAQLRATQPHFVRCIVPNASKKPGRIDVPLVLDQLRCNGVLEGIRIARLGYPNRLPFVEFRQRYEVLTPGIIPRGYMDGRKACLRMVDSLELDKSLYKVGTSKIFFKAGVLAELEERRDALLFEIFSKIQAMARMWTARRQMKKILNRAVSIRTIQRNARVYGQLRDWPWWQLYTKVRPLLAATRDDEELRKKDAELAAVKERAERDKQEREALESLRMSLESEKRKVEEDLQAERALALDKDDLLERSKKREVELEEEVTALQADLDNLDSQLDRALNIQKTSEEKYEALREAFDRAAEHLVRLENEQHSWTAKEGELVGMVEATGEELERLRGENVELKKLSEELSTLASQLQDDLQRMKERTEVSTTELETRLGLELKNRDLLQSKATILEQDARHAKEQLAELTRTATEYSTIIQAKEDDFARLVAELRNMKQEREKTLSHTAELQGKISTLTAELDEQKSVWKRSASAQAKLQAELDELRTLLHAKTSEENRRSEVEKSKDEELSDLRRRVVHLQQDLSEARKSALEAESKLKVELENVNREHGSLQQSHRNLTDRELACRNQLAEAKTSLSELEKSKRALESELLSLRSRQHDSEGQLVEMKRANEVLERQLAAAQAKYQDFEDVLLQLERDKGTQDRQLDATRKQLDTETTRRGQLEHMSSSQKAELAKIKDRNVKLDRELNKALSELKQREWEVKQLEGKQDKTIVEHVHVLEEAKRVTDRQLKDARAELENSRAYIRSLEKTKSRIAGEAEDLVRETRVEMRTKERAVKAQEEKAANALADAERERRSREVAEVQIRKLQSDLELARNKAAGLSEQLAATKLSKETLEAELSRLADDFDAPISMAKSKRDYEMKIAELQNQLENADSARQSAARIKAQIDRHHAEIRQLIMSNSSEGKFRDRLLRELQVLDEDLGREMVNDSPRRNAHQTTDPSSSSHATSPKRRHIDSGRQRGETSRAEQPRNLDSQVIVLKQHVQVLELRIAASDRVRHHLEASLRDMIMELDKGDGSQQFLQQYRSRLATENARLVELLEDESKARRAAEAAHVDGVREMWDKFQSTITEERESWTRLEESRKALLAQQRTAQVDLEHHQRQVHQMDQSNQQLRTRVIDLETELDRVKRGELDTKRKLESRINELEITSSSSHSEMREALEAYKAKANNHLQRLQEAETKMAVLSRKETTMRQTIADSERAVSELLAEKKLLESNLRTAEQTLQAKLDEDSRDSADLGTLQKQLAADLEDEREQHQKDLAERDFTVDQTRKKYQAELAQLSKELQSQRDNMSRLREDNRKLRSDYDELQLRYDDEVYNSGSWRKEKERLETKISDVNQAYETATAAQAEQQTQIVSLHSQVRELRGVLNDAETERILLQKARRALQAELETIKLDHADTTRMSSDRELQKLQLKKQDLERSLEEQGDRVAMAFDRMKKAETFANECQVELGKIRVENSELERMNANLEKHIKELNVRIVDLETRSYATSPRPATTSRRTDTRIEELTKQLNKDKGDSSRSDRSPDKAAREVRMQSVDLERQRARLEEEKKSFESQIANLRETMDQMQTDERELQVAKRRAEREAADYKQKALNLEHEVERLRNRPPPSLHDRPPLSNYPRK